MPEAFEGRASRSRGLGGGGISCSQDAPSLRFGLAGIHPVVRGGRVRVPSRRAGDRRRLLRAPGNRGQFSLDPEARERGHTVPPDQGHGLDSPTRPAGVKRVLRGLRRRAATSPVSKGQGQARGLTAPHLAAIRATAFLPRKGPSGRTESEKTARKRGAVDVALASVMRDALLRRSEAAALTWNDVTFLADGTATARHSTQQDRPGW